MNQIIGLYVNQRIDQIYISLQSAPIEKATSVENVENVNVSKEFLEVLTTSFELKTQCATTFLEKKDLIDTTESKIEMLFQNIITSDTKEKDAKFDDIVALAITYYNMGKIHLDADLQELLVISEAHFTKCMTLLKGKELERKVIITIINVLLDLQIVFYQLGQPEKSYTYLNIAIEMYSRYTKEEIEYPDPINFSAILGLGNENSNSKIILENLQQTILLCMSFYYEENYRDKHKFVTYVHYILNQLTERISYVSSTYYVHWAVTSSHLSQYFVHNYRFTEARNHLIAAEYMMKEFHKKVIQVLNEEDCGELHKSFHEDNKTGYNSVIKFWGLYGTELLVASTNELLQRKDDNKSRETDNSKSGSVMDSKEDLTKFLIFTDVEKNFENFTARFPDKCASNLNEAKVIFVNVLKCFDKVKKYFTIEDYFVDYLGITIATSKVYKCLAAFEHKIRRLKLYLRQSKILKNTCSELEKGPCERPASSLIQFKLMMKISNELIASYITDLDIRTDHLRLNIEQLNTEFTDEIKINLEKSIMNIMCAYEFGIES